MFWMWLAAASAMRQPTMRQSATCFATGARAPRQPLLRVRLVSLGCSQRGRAVQMRTTFSADEFAPTWPYSAEDFSRMDESPDFNFYSAPRFVTHIDDGAISALTSFYEREIRPRADVLDVCSSWISHLPPEGQYGRVAGVCCRPKRACPPRQPPPLASCRASCCASCRASQQVR